MEQQVFSLREAIDIYKYEGDYVQKHLGWLQIFCASTIAVAWNLRPTAKNQEYSVSAIALAIGFLGVAIPNLIIMWKAQRNVEKYAGMIKAYLEHNIAPEFEEIIPTFKPIRPCYILIMHLAFDVLVVVLVLYFMKW